MYTHAHICIYIYIHIYTCRKNGAVPPLVLYIYIYIYIYIYTQHEGRNSSILFSTSALNEEECLDSSLTALLPGKQLPVCIEQETQWAPELAWSLVTEAQFMDPIYRNLPPALSLYIHIYIYIYGVDKDNFIFIYFVSMDRVLYSQNITSNFHATMFYDS